LNRKFFYKLSDKEKTKLSEALVLKDFKQGESIFLSNHEGNEIMFVADGQVDVKRTSGSGKEVILARLGVGNFFGEIALLTGATRSADVVATEDSMILILQADAFDKILSSNPGFVRALLEDLARRVSAASTRISDLALLDVYCRVHRILCSLSVKDKNSEGKIVKERPTHKDLAAMVGTSREMVTRALSKLEEDELIKILDKSILITGYIESN
jgi:CRP-like cAMP-binding protein